MAATNPKGKFDLEQSMSVNTSLASPLLSRFDLILVLLDKKDQEWDAQLSKFVLHEVRMHSPFLLRDSRHAAANGG